MKRIPASTQPKEIATMKSVRQAVADIACGIVHEADAGASSAMIYDALMPHLGPVKQPATSIARPTTTITQASHVMPLTAAPAVAHVTT